MGEKGKEGGEWGGGEGEGKEGGGGEEKRDGIPQSLSAVPVFQHSNPGETPCVL